MTSWKMAGPAEIPKGILVHRKDPNGVLTLQSSCETGDNFSCRYAWFMSRRQNHDPSTVGRSSMSGVQRPITFRYGFSETELSPQTLTSPVDFSTETTGVPHGPGGHLSSVRSATSFCSANSLGPLNGMLITLGPRNTGTALPVAS